MKKALLLKVVLALCVIALVVALVLGLRCQQVTLDMSKDSVDDQYIDCNNETERWLMNSGNIPLQEDYFATWETAKQHWVKRAPIVGNFNPIYGTAIVAYTVGDDLYSHFNTTTREAGKSQSSYQQYAFKDFHFLLTKALQAKKVTSGCYEVFRGIKGVCFNTSKKAVVRFGQFASSSMNQMVAQRFGEDTFFSIKTCFGVPIDDFSYHKEQEEVLIPPYETFTVTNYKKTQKGVYIRLESLSVFSCFNCEAHSELRAS